MKARALSLKLEAAVISDSVAAATLIFYMEPAPSEVEVGIMATKFGLTAAEVGTASITMAPESS